MGDGADDMLARHHPEVFGDRDERRRYSRTVVPASDSGDWISYYQQEKTWRSADGKVAPVEQLDARHRRNIIRYMEERAAVVRELLMSQAEDLPDHDYELARDAINSVGDVELVHRLPLIRRLLELEAEALDWRQKEIL